MEKQMTVKGEFAAPVSVCCKPWVIWSLFITNIMRIIVIINGRSRGLLRGKTGIITGENGDYYGGTPYVNYCDSKYYSDKKTLSIFVYVYKDKYALACA